KNDGTKYEREIYNILESSHDTDSWMTNVRIGNGDKGVDILSYYKDMSLMVQCKDHATKVGPKYLRELNGIRPNNSNLLRIMVSKSGYTANVLKELKNRKKYKNIMFTDGKNLMSELKNYYNKYKKNIEQKNARMHKKCKKLSESNKKLQKHNKIIQQELDEALAILNKPKKEMGTQTGT
ncbi:14502_t:CDS:1, partial [Funneliformis geosporum]